MLSCKPPALPFLWPLFDRKWMYSVGTLAAGNSAELCVYPCITGLLRCFPESEQTVPRVRWIIVWVTVPISLWVGGKRRSPMEILHLRGVLMIPKTSKPCRLDHGLGCLWREWARILFVCENNLLWKHSIKYLTILKVAYEKGLCLT